MTVSPFPKDAAGVLLQSNITALTTAIGVTTSTVHKYQMQVQLDQLQRELVAHYLDVGRLVAANILSTMT